MKCERISVEVGQLLTFSSISEHSIALFNWMKIKSNIHHKGEFLCKFMLLGGKHGLMAFQGADSVISDEWYLRLPFLNTWQSGPMSLRTWLWDQRAASTVCAGLLLQPGMFLRLN